MDVVRLPFVEAGLDPKIAQRVRVARARDDDVVREEQRAAQRRVRYGVLLEILPVLVDGRPTGDEPALTNGHCAIDVDLALGDGSASYLTSDLSYEYVRINAEYTT